MKENTDFLDLDDGSTIVSEKKGTDWTKHICLLLSIRRQLYKASFFGLFLGLIVAFSMPKKYTVTVILSPEMGDNKISGGLASMAASLLGTATGQTGPDALNALLAPNIVSSTPFLLHLLDSKVLVKEGLNEITLRDYLDGESIPWWSYIIKSPRLVISYLKSFFAEESVQGGNKLGSLIVLNQEELDKLNKIRSQIIVDVNTKTTLTSLSVTFQNPRVAAIVADSVVKKLQNTITEYRITKSKEDAKYWEMIYQERRNEYYNAQKRYANFVDSNSHVISQSTLTERERLQNEMNLAYQMYNQVAQQLQMACAKVQENKPAFAIIEPSVVPVYPSSTSRIMVLLMFVILSIMLCVIWNIYDLRKSILDLKNLWARRI